MLAALIAGGAVGNVIELKAPPGKSFSYKELKESVEKNKPAALFLVQARPDIYIASYAYHFSSWLTILVLWLQACLVNCM